MARRTRKSIAENSAGLDRHVATYMHTRTTASLVAAEEAILAYTLRYPTNVGKTTYREFMIGFNMDEAFELGEHDGNR